MILLLLSYLQSFSHYFPSINLKENKYFSSRIQLQNPVIDTSPATFLLLGTTPIALMFIQEMQSALKMNTSRARVESSVTW